MSEQHDVVVIGGGHNGLACAAYLARAGRDVLVLEAGEQLGGLGATREFAPGYRASVAHTVPQLGKQLVEDLDLESHGFRLAQRSLRTLALGLDGSHIRITANSLEGAPAADIAAYPQYRALMQVFADTLQPFWHQTPPMVGSGSWADRATLARFGLRLRKLGRRNMREIMRMMFLPAQDLVEEFFESPLLQAALSWDANVGSKLAPRSPNNAVLALLYRMSGDFGGDLPLPMGGVGGLIDALAASAQSQGAQLRTDSPVKRVIVDGREVRGVELEDGEQIEAALVVSSADPKTSFLRLLGAKHLDVQFTHRINRLRTDGYVAKLHLALNECPDFRGLANPHGRMLLAESMPMIEDAFDKAKYGEFATQLPMEVIIPSLHDPSLAPEGGHVLSALVQYAPRHPSGGWEAHWDTFLENCLSSLERYAPDIREQVVASELLTPEDLERQFRVTGGHWHHAEFAIDNWWMNRPTYGASQYRTPVPGFYLCGAGAHPGGGIMGAAGANVARTILEEH